MLSPKLSPRNGLTKASIMENPKLMIKNAPTIYAMDCGGVTLRLSL